MNEGDGQKFHQSKYLVIFFYWFRFKLKLNPIIKEEKNKYKEMEEKLSTTLRIRGFV
jgi:hypothetical protein